MIDIKQLIETYFKSIRIRENGDYVIATPSFFHIESSESICLRFSETEDGRPVVSDCGTTRDYLDTQYIRLSDYKEKLDAIKERFFLEEEDGVFSMTIPTTTTHMVHKHLGFFIQAISIIANIDL